MSRRTIFRTTRIILAWVMSIVFLSTCQDFFGTEDVKAIIREDVTIATAPEVSVTLQAEKDSMGVPTPYGAQRLRVGVGYTVTTTVGSDYTFLRWTHSGSSGDVTFASASSITTTMTINRQVDDLLIRPTFDRRPYPLTWDPYSGNTGVITNKTITVTFSEPLDESSLDLAPDGTVQVTTWPSGSVADLVHIEHHLVLTVNGSLVSIAPDPARMPSIPFLGFHTVLVTLTSDILDAAGNGLADDFTWFFTTGNGEDLTAPVINSFTIRNAIGETSEPGVTDVFTNGSSIRLNVTALDDQQQVRYLEIRETPPGGATTTSELNFLSGTDYVLARPDDGSTKIQIRVADESRNWTTSDQTAGNTRYVFLDTLPPTITGITLGSSEFTNSATVPLTIGSTSGTGTVITGYRLSGSESVPISWADSAPTTASLEPGDGPKTVYLHIRDAAGNAAWASDTVTLDTTRPTATVGTIATTGVPGYVTNGQSISVEFTMTETGSGLAGDPVVTIGGRNAVITGAYPNYTATHVFTGTAITQGVVGYTINAVDNAGNAMIGVSESTGILYDRDPPAISSFPLPAATDTRPLSFVVEASDGGSGSGIESYAVTGDVLSGGYSGSSSSVELTLSPGEGPKQITLSVTDRAGNEAVETKWITLDTTSPTASVGTISTTGSPGYAKNGDSILVSFTISEEGSGVNGNPVVTIGDRNAVITGAYPNYTATHVFSGTSVPQGVVGYTINAVDNAGNTMTELSGSTGILYDRDPPVIDLAGAELTADATSVTGLITTDSGGSGVDATAHTLAGGAGTFTGTALTGLTAPDANDFVDYTIGAADRAGNTASIVVRHFRGGSDDYSALIR